MRPARLVTMVLRRDVRRRGPDGRRAEPVADQYSAPVDSGAAPSDGTAAAGGNPVQVRELTSAQAESLPFTGGQIALIALIGLALLALGAAGLALSRRRASAATST